MKSKTRDGFITFGEAIRRRGGYAGVRGGRYYNTNLSLDREAVDRVYRAK